jgi:hypothetical protein
LDGIASNAKLGSARTNDAYRINNACGGLLRLKPWFHKRIKKPSAFLTINIVHFMKSTNLLTLVKARNADEIPEAASCRPRCSGNNILDTPDMLHVLEEIEMCRQPCLDIPAVVR